MLYYQKYLKENPLELLKFSDQMLGIVAKNIG